VRRKKRTRLWNVLLMLAGRRDIWTKVAASRQEAQENL
jgi:hypothetical protein